jgi:LacI family transcriptional regulator
MVASATRSRVMRAVEELGYQPNQLASSLRKKSSHTIGLVVTDLLNPFHATVAKGVQDAAYEHGFSVILCNTDEDAIKEKNYLQLLAAQQLRGLVVVPTARTRENLDCIPGVPVVEVDRTSGREGVRAVLVDNVKGAREATRHLLALGHRRIATVTGMAVTTGVERFAGYLEAMNSVGLAPDSRWIFHGNHREEDGYRAARQFFALTSELRPTALFVINNESTAGVVRALRELRLRIPQDVSLVGFDDSRWARLMDPPLTVVAQPTYELGYQAGETLFYSIERKRVNPSILRLQPRLLVRGSTGPLPVQEAKCAVI